ncbi:hypothetical protein EVAR_10254_1 [Eumeta japonica]|uniref:Uncharacterized protein n=1 Tax=Eumeta variegata TaxID=151549 RepID=A0A4C1TH22_EUMVA|nr:hypothetical protein EVAR_10254_1 [Eumeta japonica]
MLAWLRPHKKVSGHAAADLWRGEARGECLNGRSHLASPFAAFASGAVFWARVKGPRDEYERVFTFSLSLQSVTSPPARPLFLLLRKLFLTNFW